MVDCRWGPVRTVPKKKHWLGALRPTNKTGELSALIPALHRILAFLTPGSTDCRNFNLPSDSEYCVRLFEDNLVNGRCNKECIRRIRRALTLGKRTDNISIRWTKANSSATTPEALGNAAADPLAAEWSSGFPLPSYPSRVQPPGARGPALHTLGAA